MKKQTIANDISPHELELFLREAAVHEGRCVPETSKELTIVEERLARKAFTIPPFSKLLARLRAKSKECKQIIHLKAHFDATVVEELSMAARNGEKVSDEVRQKMNRDREEQENPLLSDLF